MKELVLYFLLIFESEQQIITAFPSKKAIMIKDRRAVILGVKEGTDGRNSRVVAKILFLNVGGGYKGVALINISLN